MFAKSIYIRGNQELQQAYQKARLAERDGNYGLALDFYSQVLELHKEMYHPTDSRENERWHVFMDNKIESMRQKTA